MDPEDNNSGAAAPADDTPLSQADAVELLNEGDEQESHSEGAKPEGEAATPEPAQEAETPAPDAEPETEAEVDEVVHGNAKTRLRDGRVVTIGELKKLADRAQELERATPDQQKLTERQAQLAQQEQFLNQVLPHAVRIAQAAIPPEPDPSLRESDPIEFFTQQSRRAEKIAEWQQVEHARQVQEQQAKSEQDKAFQAFVSEQQSKLIEARPDIKDPAKAKELYETVKAGALSVGFTSEDVEKTYDHRLILLAEKAARWDNHQKEMAARKPVIEAKAKGAVPVQKPGPRSDASEPKAKQSSELFERLSRTGSIDDAAAYLDSLE